MNMGRSACTLLAIILSAVFSIPQAAGQCQWRLEGSFDKTTQTLPREAAYDGIYTYVLTSKPSLEIYNVADPTAIQLVSETALPPDLHALVVDGDLALLKRDDRALYTIDVSNRSNAFIADVFEFDDRPFGGVTSSTGSFGMENGVVYLPTSEGVRILDITNPTNIQQVFMINLVGGARDIPYVFQSLLRVQPISGGPIHFDVRNPASPVSINHPDPGFFDAFEGDIAFETVAVGRSHLREIRIRAYQLPTPDTSILISEIFVAFPPGMFNCGIDDISLSVFEGVGYLLVSSELTLYVFDPGVDEECLCCGDQFFAQLDVTDPQDMIILGNAPIFAPIEAKNGIALSKFGIIYYFTDMSDPVAPPYLGAIRYPYNWNNLQTQNRNLFATSAGAIHALDISEPSNPTLVPNLYSTTLPKSIFTIASTEEYLFAIAQSHDRRPTQSGGVRDRTLQAYKVGHQSLELIAEHTQTTDTIRSMDSSDTLVCFADDTTLYIYTIDDEILTPQSTYQSQTAVNSIVDVKINGTMVYLRYVFNTEVIDLSNPPQPLLVDTFSGSFMSDRVLNGNFMYSQEGPGVKIFSVRDPGNVIPIGSYTQWQLDGPIAAMNGLVCTASDDRVWFINATDPSNPFKISTRQMPGTTRDLEIADGFLVWSGDTEVRLYDLQTPADLALVASAPTLDKPFGVSSFGDLALISDFTGGLHLFDVSDIDAPTEAGFYDTPDRAYETVVVDEGGTTLAFIADGSTGLIILDITDPGSPTLVSSLALSDLALAVAVRDGYAYLGTRFDGLQIIDVSNPAAPTLIGSVDTPGSAQSVTLDGDFAYVADGSSGVQVIDISNPALATAAGSIDTPASARQVFVHGTVAYVPDRSTGLVALDISDPTNPQLTSTLGGLGDARSVTLWGHLAFVADFDGAVHMVDVADPSDMQLLESVPTPGTPRAITSDGPRIFTADGDAGLTVLETRPCWYIPCPVDTNDDGLIDFFDVQVYLAAYADNDGLADWNDDGTIDFFDLQSYLGDFAAGCP